MVTGLPASGKSTIARSLARHLDGSVLSTDRIRKCLLSRPVYTEEEKELVYTVMFMVAEHLLRRGSTVILDGTFYLRELRKKVYSLVSRTGASLVVVECTCPEDVVKRRLERRARRKGLSDADYEVYKKIKKVYEPIHRRHITVDTSHTLDRNVGEIIKNIRARRDMG